MVCMATAGFGFTRISVEKKENIKGKINIKNNVAIKEIERTEVSFGKSMQPVLKFIFEYRSDYEPGIGSIVLEGNLLDVQDDKLIDDVIRVWKKDKRINNDILTPIINNILTRCNVESLLLSREVNLPPPIPLPKVEVSMPKGK
ncbi:MAG TPA: hypothetical protein VJI75_06845 [Candidatus Nanoarchaeia archaeon]|nr:hypothetical protein [Candidatus Nanoarchaeia archaeon]